MNPQIYNYMLALRNDGHKCVGYEKFTINNKQYKLPYCKHNFMMCEEAGKTIWNPTERIICLGQLRRDLEQIIKTKKT